MMQKVVEEFVKQNHIPVINDEGYFMVSKEDLIKLLVKYAKSIQKDTIKTIMQLDEESGLYDLPSKPPHNKSNQNY